MAADTSGSVMGGEEHKIWKINRNGWRRCITTLETSGEDA
jgi:hypothetical protein